MRRRTKRRMRRANLRCPSMLSHSKSHVSSIAAINIRSHFFIFSTS